MPTLTREEAESAMRSNPCFNSRLPKFGHQLIECADIPGLWFGFWVMSHPGWFHRRVIWFAYKDSLGHIAEEEKITLQHPQRYMDTIIKVESAKRALTVAFRSGGSIPGQQTLWE